jgi:hypothetical protein
MNVTRTRNDLIVAALANLGLIQAGQAPEADDVSAIDKYIDGVINELALRGVVTISDPNAIPAEYFEALAICVADAASAEFGARGQFTDARFAPYPAGAEARLRYMNSGKPTYQVLRTRYF